MKETGMTLHEMNVREVLEAFLKLPITPPVTVAERESLASLVPPADRVATVDFFAGVLAILRSKTFFVEEGPERPQ